MKNTTNWHNHCFWNYLGTRLQIRKDGEKIKWKSDDNCEVDYTEGPIDKFLEKGTFYRIKIGDGKGAMTYILKNTKEYIIELKD